MKEILEFLNLNLKDYTTSKFPLPIGLVLTVMLLALSAAAFIITYRKRYTVAMIRGLLKHNAIDEGSARSLRSLRLSDNRGLKSALSRSGQLTFIVKRAGAIKPDYDEYVKSSKKRGYKDERINFDEAKFYISGDELTRAKTIVQNTGTSWWIPVICTVVFIAVLVLAFFYLEDLLLLIGKTE